MAATTVRSKIDPFVESVFEEVMHFFSFAVGEVFTPLFPLNFTGSRNYIAQDVMCNGTEYSVGQCPFSPPTPICYDGNRAAGVTCREGEHSRYLMLPYRTGIQFCG